MDKETVDQAQKDAEVAWTKFSLLKDAYSKAESDYVRKVNKFHRLDHALALEDGRLKKLQPSDSSKRKPKKQPKLTLDQIKGIAEKLGIKLTIETFDEEIEGLESVEPEEVESEETVHAD